MPWTALNTSKTGKLEWKETQIQYGMENKVEIGDLLVFPGQVYRVQEIRESIHHPNDPCFVITEFPESDKSVEMLMTLSEARDWNFMVYKPSEL